MSGSNSDLVTQKLAKATEFLESARFVQSEMFDAAASLAASAAINAGDVIEFLQTGRISRGVDHAQAVNILRKAHENRAASHLSYCLVMKSKSQYSTSRCTQSEAAKAVTQAERILTRARDLASGQGQDGE